MIDSHCHLADPKFTEDMDEVLARAAAAGVEKMVCIGDTLDESKRCVELADKYPALFATCGVHPHTSKEWKEASEKALIALLTSSSKVKAVGEIGLDYHYDFSPRAIQRSVFERQLGIARELKLPSVVHCREAVEDIWAIVDRMKPLKLVIHCCTERYEDVQRFVERGYLLSFTGIATYKNAGAVRDCIRRCPMRQMMIETDAPYLAPLSQRGKRNEPAFVAEVAQLIARIKERPLAEVDAITTRNAVEFFSI